LARWRSASREYLSKLLVIPQRHGLDGFEPRVGKRLMQLPDEFQ
jgi:hypothetical protein